MTNATGRPSLRQTNASRGFTLIELLVVVAIIALLVTILMPSLKRAMELTRRAICAAQQRNVGLAVMLYAGDWNGYVPQSNNSTVVGPLWGRRLFEEDLVSGPTAVQCPVRLRNDWPESMENHVWVQQYCYTYGIRDKLFSNRGGWLNLGSQTAETVNSVTGQEYTDSIKQIHQYALFVDSVRRWADLGVEPRPWYQYRTIGTFGHIHLRHLETANLWFLDGHVESMTSEQMQELPAFGCMKDGEPFRTFPDPYIHVIGGGQ